MSLFDVWWSAWIGILTRPRRTIRRIIDERPNYQLPILALLIGITAQTQPALALHGPWAWQTWFKILIVGPIVGLVTVYIGAYVLGWCGERVGGNGSAKSARAALAWSGVPGIVLFPLTVAAGVWAAVQGAPSEPIIMTDTTQMEGFLLLAASIIMAILLLAVSIWILIVVYRCYSEALELEFIWTLVALVMSTILFAIPAYFFNRLMLLI